MRENSCAQCVRSQPSPRTKESIGRHFRKASTSFRMISATGSLEAVPFSLSDHFPRKSSNSYILPRIEIQSRRAKSSFSSANSFRRFHAILVCWMSLLTSANMGKWGSSMLKCSQSCLIFSASAVRSSREKEKSSRRDVMSLGSPLEALLGLSSSQRAEKPCILSRNATTRFSISTLRMFFCSSKWPSS